MAGPLYPLRGRRLRVELPQVVPFERSSPEINGSLRRSQRPQLSHQHQLRPPSVFRRITEMKIPSVRP